MSVFPDITDERVRGVFALLVARAAHEASISNYKTMSECVEWCCGVRPDEAELLCKYYGYSPTTGQRTKDH